MKSITIGINLDSDLHPTEAGVLSLNDKYFRSGNIFDRILSVDFTDDGYRCIAPLIPAKSGLNNEIKNALDMALNNALESIIKGSLKQWKPIIKHYIDENTNCFLNIGCEFEFYLHFINYTNKYRNSKFDIVKPVISDDIVSVSGIYNPNLLENSGKIVQNDVTFDDNGRLYTLTGPNQGGKSIFLKSIGINQALFQLGVYVHAKSAELKVSANILTYFTKNNENSIGYGHLGEECKAVSDLLKHALPGSLILFDEPFSSTSVRDGCSIICEVLTALSELDAYGILITHIHEVYATLQSDNVGKIDSLIALMEDESGSKRSFRIVRQPANGKSYALDIAVQYGLMRDDIKNNVTKRG
ncbi:hypothetical protein FACS1894219_05420 [Clostridia bacterium]|nr:hypothetical protein FACS1894219_05420 [Clostridia bacterium]